MCITAHQAQVGPDGLEVIHQLLAQQFAVNFLGAGRCPDNPNPNPAGNFIRCMETLVGLFQQKRKTETQGKSRKHRGRRNFFQLALDWNTIRRFC